MKKKIIILLIIYISLFSCHQKKKNESIPNEFFQNIANKELLQVEIKSISFDLIKENDNSICNCEDFDKEYSYSKPYIITDTLKLKKIKKDIKNFKFKSSLFEPDVRTKVYLFFKDDIDTICLDKYVIMYNGKSISYDKQFVDFIKFSHKYYNK